MVTPIVAIVYLTYKTYLRNIQASLTQTKEAERHAVLLEASEERFRSAFNHASIGMALVSEDGKWLQANQALSQIVGYPNDDLLASDLQSLTHPDDLDDLLIQQSRLTKGEIPRY